MRTRVIRGGRFMGPARAALAAGFVAVAACAPTSRPAPPRAVPHSQPYIWLSSTRIPTATTPLAGMVINPTATPTATYGVAGTFERWTGRSWTAAGTWRSSMDQWGGFGSVGVPHSNAVLLIGLSAAAHATGAAEYFQTPSLAPGWYRVGHQIGPAQTAYGTFEVSPASPVPAPVENPAGDRLVANPILLPPSGGTVHLSVFPAAQGTQTYDEVKGFAQTMDPAVHLERWDGSAWIFYLATPVQDPVPPRGTPEDRHIAVPASPAGAYRIVWHNTSAGDLHRLIWISDDAQGLTPAGSIGYP